MTGGFDGDETYEFRYYQTVDARSADVTLEDLFTKFTLPGFLTENDIGFLANVKIDVTSEAIQADGFDTAEKAWAAFENETGSGESDEPTNPPEEEEEEPATPPEEQIGGGFYNEKGKLVCYVDRTAAPVTRETLKYPGKYAEAYPVKDTNDNPVKGKLDIHPNVIIVENEKAIYATTDGTIYLLGSSSFLGPYSTIEGMRMVSFDH